MAKEIVPPDCQYCNQPTKLLTGKELYGSDFKKTKFFWACKPCKAHVGAENSMGQPKGTLAKKPLRKLRRECHHHFDRHWHNNEERNKLYKRLANKMGYGYTNIHFGFFHELQCAEAILIMETKSWIEYNERNKPAKWQL